MDKLHNNSCLLKFKSYWKLPKTSRSQLQEILRKIQCYNKNLKVHNSSKTQNHCSGGEQFKSQKVICLNSSVSVTYTCRRSGPQYLEIFRWRNFPWFLPVSWLCSALQFHWFCHRRAGLSQFLVLLKNVFHFFQGSHDAHHRRCSID